MNDLMLNDLAHSRLGDLHRDAATSRLARLARRPRRRSRPVPRVPAQRTDPGPIPSHDPACPRRETA